jgi:hypothetical protein
MLVKVTPGKLSSGINLAQLIQQPDGEQRMAAALKKIVVKADGRNAQ